MGGRERDVWIVALLVGRERDGWMVVLLVERESGTAGWWRCR